jgi:anaerobic selenocysteine-containing dehydrogenase
MDRRDFLKMIGLGGLGAVVGAGAGLSAKPPTAKLIPYVIPPEDVVPGVANYYASLCAECSAGCGIHVKVQESRVKKIEGNPEHPVSNGKLCARGQAGMQSLYNPDRIKGPMKRRGKRGAGDFVEIPWSEAIGLLASKLSELQEDKNQRGLYFLSSPERGHLGALIGDFMSSYGSKNHINYELFGHNNLRSAAAKSLSLPRVPHYDIENSEFVLSFGADFASTWLSPVQFSHGFGSMRDSSHGKRGRLVQVEPRMSLTGATADEWIPAKPGSEGILALSIAYAIVEKGFYKGADGAAWKATLKQYRPRRASALTEVDDKRIYALAKEFAKTKKSLAVAGGNLSAYDNGLLNHVAVDILNYIAGNVGTKGGVIPNPRGFLLGVKGTGGHISKLTRAAAKSRAKVLIVNNANPVYTTPGAMGAKEALNNIPFIASLSSFMDETTAMADLILPSSTYLESWGDDFPESAGGKRVATIMQPAVVPYYNTKATGDILLELAKIVDGGTMAALKHEDFKSYLMDGWKALYKKEFQATAPSFNAFWNKLLQNGGIWKNSRIGKVSAITPARVKGSVPKGPARFDGDEKKYPYYLTLYASTAHLDGRGAKNPLLQELPDPMTSVVWGSWVEINPKTAKGMGLKEGDLVTLTSPSGAIDLPVYIYPAVRPDTVSVPIGQGHSAFGRYAKGRSASPLDLVPYREESSTGEIAHNSTRVSIKKVSKRGAEKLVKLEGETDEMGRNIVQTVTPAELKKLKKGGGGHGSGH